VCGAAPPKWLAAASARYLAQPCLRRSCSAPSVLAFRGTARLPRRAACLASRLTFFLPSLANILWRDVFQPLWRNIGTSPHLNLFAALSTTSAYFLVTLNSARGRNAALLLLSFTASSCAMTISLPPAPVEYDVCAGLLRVRHLDIAAFRAASAASNYQNYWRTTLRGRPLHRTLAACSAVASTLTKHIPSTRICGATMARQR